MTYPHGKIGILLHNRLRDEIVKQITKGEVDEAIGGVYALAWRLTELERHYERLNEWISVQGRDGRDPRQHPSF